MKRHDTPREVANALASHAPRNIRAILDPAVGVGNLIAPLMHRLRRCNSKVFCVDSDREAIQAMSRRYRDSLPSLSQFIHSDFLNWSIGIRRPKFDCIVMNPPFAARKDCFYQMERPSFSGSTVKSVRYMPLEVAFMCRAIELLEQKGRLLAVVPCSVVMSENLQWFRDELLAGGAIRFVHELPPRCFPGVESRMYLMVFDKNVGQKQIALLNHDLQKPERLNLCLGDSQISRLDFGFLNATIKLGSLQEYSWLDWKKISNLADILRGDIASPRGPKCAVHTTDFRSGYWRGNSRHDSSIIESEARRVRRGDVLLSRVGRNATRTLGRGVGIVGMACSDCVLIVRPRKIKSVMSLLFAMRVMFAFDWSKPLIERGTGARYISHSSLGDLPVPMGISKRFPKLFRDFVVAESDRSDQGSDNNAVMAVVKRIERLLGT